jgi:hypothetical protein
MGVVRQRLQADVEALAAFPRGSAGPGERRAAAWVAERLRAAGAGDVAVEPFRGATTYAWSFMAYAAAGLLAARTRRPLLALAALVAFALDAAGRSQPLRRVLPRGEGANVFARVPAAGERRATAVLVAHHDAARTGLVWRAGLTKLGSRRGRMPPDAAPAALAFALAATPVKAARQVAQVLLAATLAAQLDIASSPTVPGANDNATGVAAVLELVRGLVAEPLSGVEVLVAGVGCEESGMEGMRAWLDAHGEELDPSRTLVVGLDTIGSGTPIVASAEGAVLTHRYGEAEVALVEALGAERWRIGGWTDPILARFAGLRAVSVLSVDAAGRYANYHVPGDTPDRVDYGCVERCAGIARRLLESV